MNPVHFNTAGAGLLAPAAREAMAEYLRQEAEFGPYETEERLARLLTEDVYRELAALLGCGQDEVALFGSATDAWCRIVRGLRLRRGGRIWTTPYEYAANLMVLRTLCDETESELVVIPVTPEGDLDTDWMRAHLDETISLVSLVHMPSGAGIVLPLAEVVRRIRDQGGLVYLPHPFDPVRSSLGDAADSLCAAGLADIVEIFNAKIKNQALNDQSAALAVRWDLPGGAGSDAHDPAGVGAAYLEMPDFDGPASFLAALTLARVAGEFRDHAPRYGGHQAS